jgi:hypothetical protein
MIYLTGSEILQGKSRILFQCFDNWYLGGLSLLFADTLTGLTIGPGGATSSSDDNPFKLLKDQ